MKTTRRRVRDQREATTWSWADSPSHTTTIYESGKTQGLEEIILDNNNKGWRQVRRAGGVVLSDCQLTRTDRTFTPGTISNAYTTFTGDITGFASGGATIAMANTAIDSGLLLTQTIAKIKESAMMSGESLTELGQTIAMLRSPFSRAQALIKKIYKTRAKRLKKVRTIAEATRASADAWLEYRYGWKPVLMDADAIMTHILVKRGQCDRSRLVARGGQKAAAVGSGSWGPTISSDGHMSTVGSQTRSIKNRCDVGVIYDIKSMDAFEDWTSLLGLRLRDVPATLWELTPYSFVVDWFVNVGQWIQALTPVPGVTLRGWWSTTCTDEIVNTQSFIQWAPPAPQGLVYFNGSFGGEITTVSTLSRITNSPLAITPTWKLKPLSVLHQADALALFGSNMLKDLRGLRH